MESDIDITDSDFAAARYEVQYPERKISIRNRYKDTAQQIFKDNCSRFKSSLISFGGDRASIISSYGNTPTFMRRSMSSAGVLEYTYEQASPFQKSHENTTSLSTNHNSLTDISSDNISDNTNKDEHNNVEDMSDRNATNQHEVRNRKSFHQYDILETQLPSITGNTTLKGKIGHGDQLSPSEKKSYSNISSHQNSDMTKIIQNLERTIQSIPEETSENHKVLFPDIRNSQKSATLEDQLGSISLTSTGSVENSISYNIDSSGNYLYQRKATSSTSFQNSKLLTAKNSEPKKKELGAVSSGLSVPQAMSPFQSRPPKPPKPDFLLTSFALRRDTDGKDTHVFGYKRTGLKTSSYLWSSSRQDPSVKGQRPLEKTVGENLLTTQPVIKSFAYVDSEMTSHPVSNNSSRLCTIM